MLVSLIAFLVCSLVDAEHLLENDHPSKGSNNSKGFCPGKSRGYARLSPDYENVGCYATVAAQIHGHLESACTPVFGVLPTAICMATNPPPQNQQQLLIYMQERDTPCPWAAPLHDNGASYECSSGCFGMIKPTNCKDGRITCPEGYSPYCSYQLGTNEIPRDDCKSNVKPYYIYESLARHCKENGSCSKGDYTPSMDKREWVVTGKASGPVPGVQCPYSSSALNNTGIPLCINRSSKYTGSYTSPYAPFLYNYNCSILNDEPGLNYQAAVYNNTFGCWNVYNIDDVNGLCKGDDLVCYYQASKTGNSITLNL